MKKLFLLWMVLVLPTLSFAQAYDSQLTFNKSVTFTGVIADSGFSEVGLGISNHQITWNPAPGTLTCSVELDTSPDKITWTILGVSQSCATSGIYVPPSGVFNYVRINLTAYTGIANITIRYAGFPPSYHLSGTVNLNQIAASGFNVKNYGAVGDAKVSRTVTTTIGGANLVDTTGAGFLSSDVGKLVTCTNNALSSLTLTIATITSFSSATQVGTNTTGNVQAGANNKCAWFTQKDTAAFVAANAAAAAALNSSDSAYASPRLASPSSVYCPPGGYAVDGMIFNQNTGGNNFNAIGFAGSGSKSCVLIITPDVTSSGQAVLMNWNGTNGARIHDFGIDGMNFTNAINLPLINFNNNRQFTLYDFSINDYGSTQVNGALQISAGGNGEIRNILIQNCPSGCGVQAVQVSGSNSLTFLDDVFSNNYENVFVASSPGRGVLASAINFIGGLSDECISNIACFVVQGSTVNIDKMTIWGQPTELQGAFSCDGTTTAYISDTSISAFNNSGNMNAVTMASGCKIFATGNSVSGNGTGVAITGPAGASWIDAGLNTYGNYVNTTFTAATPANYGTVAFSGGIIPKSSLTHTPNTCYAGTLVAVTGQNLCTVLLDQNYMLLNVNAQSGGAAPANSSCTTAPVITLTDGTQSATLTLSTGATTWSSSGLSTIFASGATLTVSISTYTCVTPPAALSVNYVLQSILNP